MGSVCSYLHRNGFVFFLNVFLTGLISFCLISPVCADSDGYTDGAPLGAPDWVLDRMDGSTMSNLFIRNNSEESEEIRPTINSYISDGNNLLISGSFADAKKAFENAINLKPESFDAWTGRGMALEGLKRYQSALESYEKAIGFAGSSSAVWIAHAGKGRVSYNLQDYETAAMEFESAIDQYGNSGDTDLEDLIHLYEKQAATKRKLGDDAAASEAQSKAEDLRSKITNSS